MQNPAEQLKEIIGQRASFIGGDCNTFIMAKSQKENFIHDWGTGGGNFLMAVGLFAVINFLSKVFSHLVEPTAFISEAGRQTVIDAKRTLRQSHPELREVIARWPTPRVGDVNEIRAFINLVTGLPSEIDLGISTQDNISAEEIWRTFRNFLTHMAWPGSPVSTITFINQPEIHNIEQILQAIDNSGLKAFYREDNIIKCNSDKLTIDAHKIAEWLCRQINGNRFTEENITSTLAWVTSQQ